MALNTGTVRAFGSGPMLLAIIALTMGAQVPSNSEADLERLRGIGRSARMSASSELDAKGALPPEKIAGIKKMVGSANYLWSACVATTVDANLSSSAPAVTVVDRAMTACRGDGTEVGAWIRLAFRATGEKVTEDQVASILLQYDSENRRNAIVRVNRLRSSRR